MCGNSLPRSVTSSQNRIYVRFRSDSSRNHRGFSARFSEGGFLLWSVLMLSKDLRPSEIQLLLIIALQWASWSYSIACGATITADVGGGAIATPRYPAVYPPNQNCSWIIKAQEPCKLHYTLQQTFRSLKSSKTHAWYFGLSLFCRSHLFTSFLWMHQFEMCPIQMGLVC